MSQPEVAVLVLGIGNLLLRDEGVGVRVVQELESSETPLPPGTELVDGGTLGLDLLPLVDDARALVLVDAIDVGQPAGSVVVLHGSELTARLGGKVSAHQEGVGDLVSVARLRGTLPERTTLVGIQPAVIEVGLDLSPPVAAALPELLRIVREEVASLA